MLAISIHSYLYANPLHNGHSGYAMTTGGDPGPTPRFASSPVAGKFPKIRFTT